MINSFSKLGYQKIEMGNEDVKRKRRCARALGGRERSTGWVEDFVFHNVSDYTRNQSVSFRDSNSKSKAEVGPQNTCQRIFGNGLSGFVCLDSAFALSGHPFNPL
jgi:hypothetical protein